MALTAPITCLTAGGLGAVYALLQLRVGLHRFNCNILFDSKKDNGDEDQKLTAMVCCVLPRGGTSYPARGEAGQPLMNSFFTVCSRVAAETCRCDQPWAFVSGILLAIVVVSARSTVYGHQRTHDHVLYLRFFCTLISGEQRQRLVCVTLFGRVGRRSSSAHTCRRPPQPRCQEAVPGCAGGMASDTLVSEATAANATRRTHLISQSAVTYLSVQEYVPTGMLLLLLLETQTDAPKKLVAAYAAAFAAARLSHAYALSNTYTPNVSGYSSADAVLHLSYSYCPNLVHTWRVGDLPKVGGHNGTRS